MAASSINHAHNVWNGNQNEDTCPTAHQYHYIQYPTFYRSGSPADQPHHQEGQRWLEDRRMQQPTGAAAAAFGPCHCACACAASFDQPSVAQQPQSDRQLAVAVLVHQQQATAGEAPHAPPPAAAANATKAQSTQSLLSHSYQALHLDDDNEERKQLSAHGGRSTSCDCDLQCTCPAPHHASHVTRHQQSRNAFSEAMQAADEITVSESDNNSTLAKKKKLARVNKRRIGSQNGLDSTTDAAQRKYNQVYSQRRYSSAEWACFKSSERDLVEDNRPPLPPRPPQRPQNSEETASLNDHRPVTGVTKYVICCLFCGSLSCVLGVLFLIVYFMLHSYTITVGNFETVPAFVPAALLILTGLCVISLARRRNRCSYLIKLTGVSALISALVCALVTVTTTVLHMTRLQALRECEYAQKTRTCTCYSDLISTHLDRVDKEGVRLVFDSLSDCNVVHGTLYSCLRAIFALSVVGVLIAVFSCMLVYLLLSHEKKKMYWEQLELRCRSLYASQAPPANLSAMPAPGRILNCRCCEQCHAHRQLQMPLHPSGFPWDETNAAAMSVAPEQQRFWPTHPPGNFYSPNPCGEEHQAVAGNCNSAGERSRGSGWQWPRMPWQRNVSENITASNQDSQYGFAAEGNVVEEPIPHHNGQPFSVLPYNIWGPPPPYSDPNSPARRGYYQYLQPNVSMPHNNVINVDRSLNSRHSPAVNGQRIERANTGRGSGTGLSAASGSSRSHTKRQLLSNKAVYENTPSDSETGSQKERSLNTLPARKLKKRPDLGGAKSVGPNSNTTIRPNVQQVFTSENQGVSPLHQQNVMTGKGEEKFKASSTDAESPARPTGVENSGYQGSVESNNANVTGGDAFESDVYFADVSSCCGVSEKNDHYYDNAKDRNQHENSNSSQSSNQSSNINNENCDANDNNKMNKNNPDSCADQNEDYLIKRLGQRENSIRSRLPFPQQPSPALDDAEEYQANAENTTSTQQQQQKLPKDVSCQSMCSVESEAKTELTDLSPGTPTPAQALGDLTEGHYEIVNDFQYENQPSRKMPNFFDRNQQHDEQGRHSRSRQLPRPTLDRASGQVPTSYHERRSKRL